MDDIILYESQAKARSAFLDAYFGDAGFDRKLAAEQAGVPYGNVVTWFADPEILVEIEDRLKSRAVGKANLQQMLLDQAAFIMEGNITDLFDSTPDGNLIVKNIKTLPRHITACIKQMDVIRTTTPGPSGRPEYTEALRVVMHDKTKVMNIIGDYTDVKNTALKRADSGSPKMVGLSVLMARPTGRKGTFDGDGNARKISHDETAERDYLGKWSFRA